MRSVINVVWRCHRKNSLSEVKKQVAEPHFMEVLQCVQLRSHTKLEKYTS